MQAPAQTFVPLAEHGTCRPSGALQPSACRLHLRVRRRAFGRAAYGEAFVTTRPPGGSLRGGMDTKPVQGSASMGAPGLYHTWVSMLTSSVPW